MKHILFALFLVTVSGIVFFSCAKYKDPSPVNLHLTRPYCNDPAALNYNDSFPGVPDSTVCRYPSDAFAGVYIFHDSIFNDTIFIGFDSLVLRISAYSKSQISVFGFCSDTFYKDTLTAYINLIANVDTSAGDSLTLSQGQLIRPQNDTLTGTMQRDPIDTSLIHIYFTVVSDTGTNLHIGTAVKQ
jgi:hypothetical protein